MKLVKKYHIELDESDKSKLLISAREINKDITQEDFFNCIEKLMNDAVLMMRNRI